MDSSYYRFLKGFGSCSLTLRNRFFKKYGELPSGVHRVTDPVVKVGYKVSPKLRDMKSKGDVWVAKKKSGLIK